LTFVDVDSISFVLLQAAGLSHSVTSPLRVTNACAGLCREGTEERLSASAPISSKRFGSLELCRQSTGYFAKL